MVTKYIERKDVIEAICNLCRMENDDCSYPRCTIINTAKNIHAADVVERKKGVYLAKIFTDDKNPLFDAPLVSFWCLECDYTDKIIADSLTYKFCPNCGARMVTEDV